MTVSFWVKASTAATYSAGFRATMNSTTWGNHQAFTINTANTWEKKTLTFNPSTAYQLADIGTSLQANQLIISLANSASLGQTTSLGSWVTGNLIGLDSTTNMDNLSTMAAGEFVAFTGVQLELGSVATEFEHRSYGEELALCQRYYEISGSYYAWGGSAAGLTTSYIGSATPSFVVAKRSTPTVVVKDGAGISGVLTRHDLGNAGQNGANASIHNRGIGGFSIYSSTGQSASGIYFTWTADAEL